MSAPEQDNYPQVAIREGQKEDFAWIRQLALRSVVECMPELRHVKRQEVQARAKIVLEELELSLADSSSTIALIAIDAATDKRLGYILLDLDAVDSATGEPQALIRDIAGKEGRVGELIAGQLIAHAARLAYARGLKHIFGEMTAGRPHSLRLAQALGFSIERYGVVAATGPGGITPAK